MSSQNIKEQTISVPLSDARKLKDVLFEALAHDVYDPSTLRRLFNFLALQIHLAVAEKNK